MDTDSPWEPRRVKRGKWWYFTPRSILSGLATWEPVARIINVAHGGPWRTTTVVSAFSREEEASRPRLIYATVRMKGGSRATSRKYIANYNIPLLQTSRHAEGRKKHRPVLRKTVSRSETQRRRLRPRNIAGGNIVGAYIERDKSSPFGWYSSPRINGAVYKDNLMAAKATNRE